MCFEFSVVTGFGIIFDMDVCFVLIYLLSVQWITNLTIVHSSFIQNHSEHCKHTGILLMNDTFHIWRAYTSILEFWVKCSIYSLTIYFFILWTANIYWRNINKIVFFILWIFLIVMFRKIQIFFFLISFFWYFIAAKIFAQCIVIQYTSYIVVYCLLVMALPS